MEMPGVLLIGVGNPDRCDDSVGLVVARSLAAKNLPDVTIIESRGEGISLSETWEGADSVILVDAVSSGAEPGTVLRLEADRATVPTRMFRSSTHNFGVGEAIEMARSLNRLPRRLTVFGIEGKDFEMGIGISSEVVRAARRVVTTIAEEIKTEARGSSRTRRRRRTYRTA
ncbi:MAG: hydrogenase maturation protease [Rudaea sp.]